MNKKLFGKKKNNPQKLVVHLGGMETNFANQAPFHYGIDILLLDLMVQQKVNTD